MYTTTTFYEGKPSENLKNMQVHLFSDEIYAIEDKGVHFDSLSKVIESQQKRADNVEDIICVNINHTGKIIVAKSKTELFKKHFK